MSAYRTAQKPDIKYGSHLGTRKAAFERAVDIGAKFCIMRGTRSPHDRCFFALVKNYGGEIGERASTLDALDYYLYWWRANISRYSLDGRNTLKITDNISHEGDWAHETLKHYLERKEAQHPKLLSYTNLAEDRGSQAYVVVDPDVATLTADADIDMCFISSSAKGDVLRFMKKLQESCHPLGRFVLTSDEYTRQGDLRAMQINSLSAERLKAIFDR